MTLHRSRAVAVTALLGAALLTPAVASPAHAAGNATVSVLHGVPGLTVDVYANGDKLLSAFKPGTLTDPVSLPEGTYDLAVFPEGQGPSGTPAIKADDVKVPGGANITVVAHLDAAGKPVLTPFVNDTKRLGAGKARLTVRHTAAAPAVDIRAGGTPVVKGLVNPKEASLDLDAATVNADVVLAGTSTVAIGPADLDLKEGTSTIVYAWGSAADNNLQLAVQTISGLHGNPSGVPGGTGGQAAQDGVPAAVVGSVAAGLLAMLAGIGLLRRRTAALTR
ncbi:MAG: DUF4397 domain-containing protein [Kineosporiaceae bacterium]